VGNDVDRYQVFNTKLQEFARKAWPAMRHRQAAILAFLYEGLGMLFLEKSSYNRYWIMVTKPEHWDSLDRESEPEWSGRKEMKDGDLVFMYRTSPRKAITNLYRVHGAPWFDPWGAWDGWWVKLQSVGAIPEITFAAMRADPVLKDWGLVRRQFQWTVTERVPHRVYNQLLQKMPPEFCEQYDLRPVELGRIGSSGKYGTEAEFEDEVVKPLIRRWGLQFDYQYPCLFYVGSQATRGRVDCFVRDARGPITLFENKLRIANMAERESAVAQAKSYALMLGLPSFIVAAPEGLWVYSLTRNRHIEECYVPGDQLGAQEEHVRNVVMRLRM
jgi:predicted RNA-binding protein with PUA-like domain